MKTNSFFPIKHISHGVVACVSAVIITVIVTLIFKQGLFMVFPRFPLYALGVSLLFMFILRKRLPSVALGLATFFVLGLMIFMISYI